MRKAKTSAMRELRQAQRERKTAEAVRMLKGKYLKATRNYSKVLKRSKRLGDARMSAKANFRVYRFVLEICKTLDTNASSQVDPTFSVQDVEEFFTKTYSSTPCNFAQPDWLPFISEPRHSFDCDPIRLDEVVCVIKRAKAFSSPSPHDAIS